MTDLETKKQDDSKPNPHAPDSAPGFAAASAPSYTRTLFFAPDGLRPGWGLAFYILLFLLLQQLAVQFAWRRNLGDSGLWSMLLEEFGRLLAALVPSILLTRLEHRSWSTYGLPPKQAFGSRFASGALWGFTAITLLIFALYGFHSFSFGHVILHRVRMVRFAMYWALYFLLVGLFEEFLLRGYTQYTLTRGIGFWPAAFALSGAFGLIHLGNEGEQWPGALAAAFIGLFFCLTLKRTGTLWFAVGFHAAWDWGETFFYSVPDSGMVSPGHLLSSALRGPHWLSGGSVGPEGSVLCFAVITIVWILFAKTHPSVSARKLSD